jgi:hypothetical protein
MDEIQNLIQQLERCIQLTVPEEACTVDFGEGEYAGTLETEGIPTTTVRGDMCFFHVDPEGRLLSIELVGGKQPCMKTVKNAE